MNNPGNIKRRNTEKTMARILSAANEIFSDVGYAQAGIREIARLADVSPSLPIKYFGSKAGLFEASLHNSLDLHKVLRVEKKDFGKTLVKAVCDHENPITLSAMISLSIGDPEAAAIAGEFTNKHMIDPISKWLGPPKADARAYLIVMISTGFMVFHRHLLADDSIPAKVSVAKWLANTIQDLVDGGAITMEQFLSTRPSLAEI